MNYARRGSFAVIKGQPGTPENMGHVARVGRIDEINGDEVTIIFKEGDAVTFLLNEVELIDWPLGECDPKREKDCERER